MMKPSKFFTLTADERIYLCAELVHYLLVIIDDKLCEWFGFNRKGRGKYGT